MSKQINLNTYYYKKSDIDTFLASIETRVDDIEDALDDKVDISDFNTLQTQIINIINGTGEE